MALKNNGRFRRRSTAAGAAAAVVLLSACTGEAQADYPQAHIHGMSVEPDSNRVLLATHDGLYDVGAGTMISPTIDLMGFTATGEPGHFYASGHPGAGVDLPNPVGLIESRDGGKTWQPLSRTGESDFHALTVSDTGVVGFDGAIRTSGDEQSWSASQTAFEPADLSGTPENQTVLATTGQGLQRSTDGGETWAAVPDAPLMYLTDFASGERAAGVTPDGQVHTTEDGGLTWQRAGSINAEPHAITAAIDDGALHIWAATAQEIRVSTDGGSTFSAWTAP